MFRRVWVYACVPGRRGVHRVLQLPQDDAKRLQQDRVFLGKSKGDAVALRKELQEVQVVVRDLKVPPHHLPTPMTEAVNNGLKLG